MTQDTALMAHLLRRAGFGATKDDLEQIGQEVMTAVEDATTFAKDSPLPKPEDALLDVFAP